jgi:hypothetical protein
MEHSEESYEGMEVSEEFDNRALMLHRASDFTIGIETSVKPRYSSRRILT